MCCGYRKEFAICVVIITTYGVIAPKIISLALVLNVVGDRQRLYNL